MGVKKVIENVAQKLININMLTPLSSFNQNIREHAHTLRPRNPRELISSLKKSVIARGNGSSYGDAAFNLKGKVLLTEQLNCFIAFDKKLGVITAESGTLLADILKIIVPSGWFLPVTPGTQYVSLGGCVACDVHGKNHHKVGSFSAHVLMIELLLADSTLLQCSANNNADIFWATVGGMGLTGIIYTVTLQLIPAAQPHMFVKHHIAQNLDETFYYLSDTCSDDDYSVAWLDLLNHKKEGERSIIMTAHHGDTSDIDSGPAAKFRQNKLTLPYFFPSWFLNKTNMSLFNNTYFKKQSQKKNFTSHYQEYFYPLDKINHWPYLYGKKGFIQYQCVFPHNHAKIGIRAMLDCLDRYAYPIYLAVLKRMGTSSQGLLSFPIEGFTLALDMPIHNRLGDLVCDLDNIVMTHGGRVYLAKDSRLTSESFRAMYPRYQEWLTIKNQIDPNEYFVSNLGRRLGLHKS
jgi:decaprenylphospho-beta-D-ribofuranose 2-oxidase